MKQTKTDVNVGNDIMKMYMSDAQYERVHDVEQNEGKELTDKEYWSLRCKLY